MSPSQPPPYLPDSARQKIVEALRSLGEHMAQATRAQQAGLDVADQIARNQAARAALTRIHAAYFAPLDQMG